MLTKMNKLCIDEHKYNNENNYVKDAQIKLKNLKNADLPTKMLHDLIEAINNQQNPLTKVSNTILNYRPFGILEKSDAMKIEDLILNLQNIKVYKNIYYFKDKDKNNLWLVIDDSNVMDIIDCTTIIEEYIDINKLKNFDYMIFGEDKINWITKNLEMRKIKPKEFTNGK